MFKQWGLDRNQTSATVAAASLAVASVLIPVTATAAPVYSTGFEVVQPAQVPDLSGQFRMDVFAVTTDDILTGYDFVFHNLAGGASSSLAQIYFEDTFDEYLFFPSTSIVHSAGDPWGHTNVSPNNLPGAGNYNFTHTFASSANSPAPHNGVQPGEFVTISFDLASTYTDTGFLFGLNNTTLRVGMHVVSQSPTGTSNAYLTSVPPGGDDPGDPAVVPVPPAVGIGLLGFAVVGLIQFRKRIA